MRTFDRVTTDHIGPGRPLTNRVAPPSPGRQRLPATIEWPTIVVAAVVWAGLITIVAANQLVPWWVTVPLLAVASGWYASLQHEVAHGHPTPWPIANLAIAGAPIGVVYPFGRFRDLHLDHHLDPSRLTEPGVDTESRYCSPEAWERAGTLMRLLLQAERTMVGFLTVGVVRGAFAYIGSDLRLAARDTRVGLMWLRHLLAVGVLVVVIVASGLPLVQYAAGAVYGRVFFTGLRVFAEHRAVSRGTRSAVVHASLPMRLIFLNNTLHHTHHARPATAWFRLPALHDELGSDELARRGAGLYEGGYLEMARRYAFRPFCQPVHPAPR
jgi:fatty acid desaturase